jgi:hypothetical protein
MKNSNMKKLLVILIKTADNDSIWELKEKSLIFDAHKEIPTRIIVILNRKLITGTYCLSEMK